MQTSEMGKAQLRTACKEARVKNYSKMTKEQMVAALTALQPTAVMESAFQVPEKNDAVVIPELQPAKRKAKDKPAPPVVKVAREERNGVKRPVKGVCADVWHELDQLRTKGETELTAAIHAIGEKRGWNKTNTSLELSAYRRFHGISRKAMNAA